MIEIRPFNTLGHANHGWLDAHFHFAIAQEHDPSRTHWGDLVIWNDDSFAPHSGFPSHPHRDMEIITYVRSGALTHQDSLGNKGRTEAGDVQVISAGTGIAHSEYNLEDETTTLFQIWISPNTRGKPPSWGTRAFPRHVRSGRFVALASGFADDDDVLPIRANACVLGATLKAGESAEHTLRNGHRAYLVPAKGRIEINGLEAQPRDGVAITQQDVLRVTALDDAELVLVELA